MNRSEEITTQLVNYDGNTDTEQYDIGCCNLAFFLFSKTIKL